jgi:hypothetical protein
MFLFIGPVIRLAGFVFGCPSQVTKWQGLTASHWDKTERTSVGVFEYVDRSEFRLSRITLPYHLVFLLSIIH